MNGRGLTPWQDKPRYLPDRDAERPDKVDVILDAVDPPLFGRARDTDVVEEPPVLDGVSRLDLRSRQEREQGRPRPAVEVDDGVEAFFPHRAHEGEELFARLALRDRDDTVDVGIPFDELPVRRLDDVDELRPGQGRPQGPDGRGRQDDVADPPKPDEEDLAEAGRISP